ncbi:translation initiation factor IF-2 [Armatimonas sp.]|uniref:translation initiation factor IF-2 n=1 Tax=Armatimonas sp. TaxID=1872638 RepID=UPI00286C34C8|nr:translation initiation factor IF-2 [Armatimonas sp.]
MPVKVFELAKEIGLANQEMVSRLDKAGFGKLAPSHELDDATADKVRKALAVPAEPATPAGGDLIIVPMNVTVKELGEKLGVGPSEVQKVLMGLGVLAGLNQRLAPDAVRKIAKKLGKNAQVAESAPTATPEATKVVSATPQTEKAATPTTPKPQTRTAVNKTTDSVPRPPVVTIMGHVDHGKTSLLDFLRKAHVVDGEAGRITQHIGAYQVEIDGKRITFLDTPGHAAFSAMRRRGASVTDIAIIVVAANDSVMPQTEEAIQVALKAKVPIIVAVNKCDLPEANPDKVLTDLTRYELVPEAFGGTIPTVNISAKTGEGIPELLEAILLVSEIEVDPKADPHAKMRGTIIEAKVDKGRGTVATVLVQQGTLRQGDNVVAGGVFGKVRGMTDERGTKLVKAGPSSPVEIIGLSGVPDAGEKIEVAKDEKEARALAQRSEIRIREQRLTASGHQTLEQLYAQLRSGPVKELNLVIKADVQGSVQAIRESVEPLGNEEVRVRVLSATVGPVSDSDVLLASADHSADEKNCMIVGFNVGTAGNAVKKAEAEHVQIKMFSIIYELIDAVKDGMLALLPPIYEEAALGKTEIRQLFRLPGGRSIAGSYVLDGVVKRNSSVRVFRGKDLLHDGPIETLKRFKDDQREVAAGYECGITIRGFNDLQVGDILECYEMRQIQREL